MTKLESIIREKHEMACHNLLCYSATYGMDTPKAGLEVEFKAASQEVQEVEEVMDQLGIRRCNP